MRALRGILALWLAGAGPAAAAEPTALLFGFAKQAITPEVGERPVYLAGFGQNRLATGVHDELWARALALGDGRQKLAIVSVDLVGVFHADVQKARERLQRAVPGAALIVTSTHNHEGPDTMGLWGPSRFSTGVDRAYLERVRVAIADTAAQALSRLQPATLTLGKTRTPELIEDGRLPRVIDDVLLAMQVRGADGSTLGSVVNWGSHPEAIGSRNTLVSSDYPHWLRRRMEEKLGGTSVFIVGSIGGLMTPLGLKLSDAAGVPIPKDSFAFAQAVGERAADAAVAALANGTPLESTALELRSSIVYVPLENSLFRLAAFLGVIDRPLYSHGRPATAMFGNDLRTEIGYLRLGEIEALLVPAEIYPELVIGGIQEPPDPAADFKDAPREKTLYSFLKSEHRMVIGLANDEIGYVIPRRQWDVKAPFAYGRSKTQYGEVNSVGPSAAALLARAFERLLAR
jgi:hypothetical protein